jgi:hypothetical protein
MKIASALCSLVLGLWAGLACAADPLAIPGTRVTLVPPEGFALSKDFAGLQGDKASVMVIELPGAPYETLVAAISSGVMARQGVEITGGEELAGLPSKARTFKGRQVAQGADIDKWLLLVDGGPALVMLNVSALKGMATVTDAQVQEMFRSVRVAAAPSGDPVAALPFAVTTLPRFSHQQVLGGAGLIIGSAPFTEENAGQPGLTIVRTFEQPIPKEQWNQAVTAFLQGMKAIAFDKADPPTPVKIGGLEGLQFIANGTAAGAPRKTLVTMLFTAKGGYTLIAMASPELFDGAEKDFRTMIESFRVK